jgi:hypothetical protein
VNVLSLGECRGTPVETVGQPIEPPEIPPPTPGTPTEPPREDPPGNPQPEVPPPLKSRLERYCDSKLVQRGGGSLVLDSPLTALRHLVELLAIVIHTTRHCARARLFQRSH